MSERRLVMVPGPINYEPSVLRELAISGLDHTSLEFVEIFADALADLLSALKGWGSLRGGSLVPRVYSGSTSVNLER